MPTVNLRPPCLRSYRAWLRFLRAEWGFPVLSEVFPCWMRFFRAMTEVFPFMIEVFPSYYWSISVLRLRFSVLRFFSHMTEVFPCFIEVFSVLLLRFLLITEVLPCLTKVFFRAWLRFIRADWGFPCYDWGFSVLERGFSVLWLRFFSADWGSSVLWQIFPCWLRFYRTSLRFFRAFSSVVRQMPGYNSQRRGKAHTLPS